jgi:hypothetical protein
MRNRADDQSDTTRRLSQDDPGNKAGRDNQQQQRAHDPIALPTTEAAADNGNGRAQADRAGLEERARRRGVLRTAGGGEYQLRRSGGNAFRDEVLERLVGATITGLGIVTGRDYIMDEFTEENGAQE